MSRKLEPTKDEVKEKFLALLKNEGQITSLEIKDALRKDGFWATQMTIGPMIHKIADEDNIHWDFNGTYRTYYYKVAVTQTSTGLISANHTTVKPKSIDPKDKEPLDTPEDGCWECKVPGLSFYVMYFTSKLTAGQARSAYQYITSANYVDIRSRKYVA